MKIIKINLHAQDIPKNAITKITTSGDVVEVMSMNFYNNKARIRKIDKDTYEVLRNHEIRNFNHDTNRNNSLAQTFIKLRHLINANITSENMDCVHWVTLTYAENMTDTERLYQDFRKFILRLKYYANKNDLPNFEYITVVEPQARGAWHHHALLIWETTAPYIPNDVLAKIWGFGFVKIQSLHGKQGVTNIGRYLTAYLTDIDLNNNEEILEVSDMLSKSNCKIKNIKGKRYVKGARLHMYPPNMRIFRHSKNIKQPSIIRTNRENAVELMEKQNAEYQCKSSFCLCNNSYICGVFKEYYNISPLAQVRAIRKRSIRISRQNRNFYTEFSALQLELTEYIEYAKLDYL